MSNQRPVWRCMHCGWWVVPDSKSPTGWAHWPSLDPVTYQCQHCYRRYLQPQAYCELCGHWEVDPDHVADSYEPPA
jgi:phage terminase large subunit GpA-like protein